jgi:two-component system alkaline phosphatase synthesis response regulator PhoP
MSETRTVLVVDDEAEGREFLESVLSSRFNVLLAENGLEGLGLAKDKRPDLILLDINLPGMDGISVCAALRNDSATRHIPILMVTGNGDLESRVKAFDSGADDFIEKPYSVKELVARIHSKVRRLSEVVTKEELITCGNLTLDLKRLEARVEGKRVELSVLEFNLLKYLVLNKESVMSRDKILAAVWPSVVVEDRTVDTRIAYLRKKLAGFDHKLSTVYGAGYILKA